MSVKILFRLIIRENEVIAYLVVRQPSIDEVPLLLIRMCIFFHK